MDHPSTPFVDADLKVDNYRPNPEEGKISAPPASRKTLTSVILVLTCAFALLINIANSTSVFIALPTIGRELDIEEAQLQWLVSAYPLSSGCLLLMFGRLADLHGRKRTFVLGSFSLAAFTLGCGFAKSAVTLEILRGFQGIGAAAIIPASLGILAHAFPPSRARAFAFATFAAGAPIGAGFGGAIGGAVTQLTAQTWRSTFYVQTGLTVLCLIGGLLSFDPDLPSTEIDRRVDWFGAFLVTAGLVLVVFVLGQGEIAPKQWSTPYIIALLVVGVFLLVLFLSWQKYLESVQNSEKPKYSIWTPPPLMKISLWGRSKGRFTATMGIAFLTWCSFQAWNFWAILFYQDFMGFSPLETVARMSPTFVCGILCTAIVGLVVGRLPVIYLLVTGTLLTTVACLLFALIIPSASYWAFGFPAAVLSVVGVDFVYTAGTIFIAKIALPHEQSVAGALFQTMTQVGTSVGAAVTTVVFNRIKSREISQSVLADSNETTGKLGLHSYQAAQWTAFAFGAIGTILALIFFKGVGIIGHEEKVQSSGSSSEKSVTRTAGEV